MNQTKTVVIYHRADFDGIFCREIAKRFLPEAELIGWDYNDAKLAFPSEGTVYVLDLSPECFGSAPDFASDEGARLIWIDHHKSAIEKWPSGFRGYRIDGVAACRLAWFWFSNDFHRGNPRELPLATKDWFVDRIASEPLAVRLAGEYDIWDKRDPRAELFQHGLRSKELTEWDWRLLVSKVGEDIVAALLERGAALQYAQTRSNESVIREFGFTFQWEGLTFLACNNARYNSHLFTAGIRPEHDALFGFNWTGKDWRVSLYGVPGKPDVDLAAIAVKNGGGGHKQACGFRCGVLPFPLTPMELAPAEIEAKAGKMYEAYCVAVGGKAFNGDPLPSWAEFRADPAKRLQSNAWVSVARA